MIRLSIYVALLIGLCSCSSTATLVKTVRTEEVLSRSMRNIPRNELCPIDYDLNANTCYTSSDALPGDPIGVLHSRFLVARASVIDCNGAEANNIALCAYGFLLSCELADVLKSYAYARDGKVVYQLQSILAGYVSEHLERIFPAGSLYPTNYDPRDRKQFEAVLRKAIQILKANDAYWRSDWE